MTIARKFVVKNGVEETYHCISRCVRRAYLCGYDSVLGRSFDHRKKWVRDRLQYLVQIFCIEVLDYALMSNHQHILLRTRPDLLKKLSDEEIAIRWLKLFPKEFEQKKEHLRIVSELADNKSRICLLRDRLSSISWFMKSFSEYIARRANKEDGCKGRFWEGRFRCQKLCDEAAILACSVYINLNPIRAEVADTPETSKYTSGYERIMSLKMRKGETAEPSLWIAPIQNSPLRRGYLSISLEEYLMILDKTGREVKSGKRGKISSDLDPILKRTGIDTKYWTQTVMHVGRRFSSFVGSKASLESNAKILNKSWLKGFRTAEKAFL